MSETPTTNQPNRLPLLVAGFAVVSMVMAGAILLSNDDATPPQSTPRSARVPSGGESAATGWQVPDFEIALLDGETRTLTDYRGQIVFLNFWATWCVPCQREMPAFQEFMAAGPDDAVILAVNNGEDPAAVRDFVRLFQLDDLPVVMDPDFTISDGFGIVNLPLTYVLDGAGVVQGFHIGEITREDIDAYIADIRGNA